MNCVPEARNAASRSMNSSKKCQGEEDQRYDYVRDRPSQRDDSVLPRWHVVPMDIGRPRRREDEPEDRRDQREDDTERPHLEFRLVAVSLGRELVHELVEDEPQSDSDKGHAEVGDQTEPVYQHAPASDLGEQKSGTQRYPGDEDIADLYPREDP